MDQPLLYAGLVVCAALAAFGLLSPASRTRLPALSGALVLAPVLVLGDNWDGQRISDLRDHPSLLAAGVIAALVGLLIAGLVLRRWPGLLAPALIATLPFRIPVDLGGGSSNLLLPLYVVIAGGMVAALLGARVERRAAPAGEVGRGWLRWTGTALGGFLLLYALQAGYADDLSTAIENVGFFLVPFAAMFLLLTRVEWDERLIRTVVLVLAVEGLLLAIVAGYQYAAGDLFWNDKVISGNEAHPYFRVNSLFWDPNILGRYLAVSMTAFAAVVAFGRRRADLLAATALFVVLLATLVVTFSQTSTIALLAGVLVLLAARWGLLAGVVAGALTVLALAASLALIGGGGLSSESSGRSGLIDGGLHIAEDAPVFGVGSGGFAGEFTARYGGGEGIAVESHTEPVTVAAEQGAVGLLAYGALLVVTVGGLLGAVGLALRERARGTPLAAAALAVYAVMLVHSLGYAAFLTDPITWALLAIAAAALAPAPARAPEPRAHPA
jgi:putative inorganic carbon (HCO3(-)) transporter